MISLFLNLFLGILHESKKKEIVRYLIFCCSLILIHSAILTSLKKWYIDCKIFKINLKQSIMPLLTTTTLAVLYPFLIELAKKGADKIVETSSEKFTSGSISWLKSLFFKDEEPKKALKELINEPENVEKQTAIKTLVENSIEDNPEYENYLNELLDKLPKIENNISNSKNVITGNVYTGGGNFINGDGNQMS